MNNILLDYFFPITVINPTPAASTAFLKQLCLAVKPKSGVPGASPVFCATMAEVALLTDNTEAEQLFAAGMSGVYILTTNDLDMGTALIGHEFDFFTLVISSDFEDSDIVGQAYQPANPGAFASADIFGATLRAANKGIAGNNISISLVGGGVAGSEVVTVDGNQITVQIAQSDTRLSQLKVALDSSPEASALASLIVPFEVETDPVDTINTPRFLAGGENVTPELPAKVAMNLGAYKGVTGVSSSDDAFLEAQAVIENRCAFKSVGNGAKNLLFAFGKLLSNAVNWANQQFITMPFSDNVNQLGNARNYFDKRISFVIDDAQFGKRLSFFGCGGKAIVAPYIVRNLVIDMQSQALSYVSSNQPGYTKVHAALMEDELQKIITGTEEKPGYVERGWITRGKVEIKLEQANFVASGYIEIAEPGALWRIDGQVKQTNS